MPPVAAFDIETVPDTEVGRRLYGLTGSFAEVCDAMLARRLEETDGRTDFLKPPLHRIVTISVAWLNPESGQFKLDSLAVPDGRADEGAMLEAFFTILKQRPRLVSYNGNGFDLPVLRYRAMLHGIDAETYYSSPDRFNTYTNRYHEQHTDVMDVLAGYGASERIGLDALCQIADLPGKTVTEGHRVYQHVARQEWHVVETYCELDALSTLMLYLAWDRSRGNLTPTRFEELTEIVAAHLVEDERPAVAEYGTAIRSWTPGHTRGQLAQELPND